jgi:hypothetical protein
MLMLLTLLLMLTLQLVKGLALSYHLLSLYHESDPLLLGTEFHLIYSSPHHHHQARKILSASSLLDPFCLSPL